VSRLLRWAAAAAVGAAIVTACQERLTSPAQCPELCPGGSAQVFDTIVPAVAGLDSSFPAAKDAASGGYVARGGGVALLLSSDGFAASQDRAIYRYAPRSDQVLVRDTARSYIVDSAQINLTIVARDTLVGGLRLYLYRLPSSVDSTASFETIDPLLVDANLIDSIVVPDSVHRGTVSAKVIGTDLSRIALVGADSTLAIGLRMAAVTPTGIRVGSLVGTNASTFITYVTANVPDTATAILHPALTRATAFNTFVTQNPIVPVDSLVTVGSEPSNRGLLRFALSSEFLDSSTIVRATLELTPVQPIIGLPDDPSILRTLAVVGDLGAKSPITTDVTFIRDDTLPPVQSDTLRVDITRIVHLWQSTRSRPQSVSLRMVPEAATFGRAVFFSTRSHGPDPSVLVAPRLRITYQRSFPFENP
jgi:hypothetical protein